MCKEAFGEALKAIYDDRTEILSVYFTSINIPAYVIAEKWGIVQSKVKSIDEWCYNDMALK